MERYLSSEFEVRLYSSYPHFYHEVMKYVEQINKRCTLAIAALGIEDIIPYMTSNETIIVGLCCLFLAIVFSLFKPQFFILLNRLTKIEFGRAKNLRYIDQDFEPELPNTDQDFRLESQIPSWITLTSEKFVRLIFILTILSTAIYITFDSFSRVLVWLGNIEYSAGNEKLGTASYNLALEFNRGLNQAVNQCYAYNTQQEYELAINHCSKAIEINENYATAYSYRGYAYSNLKQYDQAIADFTKDIELIPIATRSYINRGSVYMQQGEYDLAIAEFTNSIDINPKEPQAWLNRGLSYIQQGQSDLAIIDCNKAIELEAKYWNAYFCLGLAFAKQEKYELAKTNFDKAIELAPSNQAMYFYRGSVYDAQGEKELAIADYTKAIEIDPQYVDAYIGRGSVYVALGKNDLAIADLTKAKEIDPAKADVFVWLGHAYANSQQFPNAISSYEKAITISQEAYTYCVLGVTYTKVGDFSSAIISFEEGINLDGKGEISWCKTALKNAQQGIPTP